MVELDEVAIVTKIKKILPLLNEYQKRVYLASEADILDYGGVSKISRETGVPRVTISSGLDDILKKYSWKKSAKILLDVLNQHIFKLR